MVGLFVRGAHRLEPQSDAEVEIGLPGYGSFTVRGKVAHIVSPELAAATGRRPGAGLEITQAPDGFYPVLAVVVTRAREEQLRPAAAAAGVGDLVHLLDHEEELDELLGAIDNLL